MGEVLPDGTIQGYTCTYCAKECNIQGSGHGPGRCVPLQCGYCGRSIRRNASHRTFAFADSRRRPVHTTCLHRLTAGDGCGCDICTGDIH